MPYYDGWNPNKGGSLAAGAQWIIDNLGHRPGSGKEYHLHIVDRRIGFMPGNLQWIPCTEHKQQELIPRLMLEIQQLRAENMFLRGNQ